jgi:type I restriction enzyme M protein
MPAKKAQAITTQAGLDSAIKSICDILRRDKAKGARLYVPELTWMLFLSALDVSEAEAEARSDALNVPFVPALESPYRWRDWAAKPDASARGWKRKDLIEKEGDFLAFVNGDLFPTLAAATESDPGVRHVIGLIFANKQHTLIESETNLLDALDRVDDLSRADVSDQHLFFLSQAFEGLLPRLGEKKNDGGQFFTPREVIRLITQVVSPKLGSTVYDPCCGTGGFLIEAYKWLLKQQPSPSELSAVKTSSLWGREYAGEVIPVALANMLLHDIDLPRIWHGNTLTGVATDDALWFDAPQQFDYVLTNPPFGSKEGKDAQAAFAYKTGKAQILFLQHVINSLNTGGTCGMVIDEGVLFHTKTAAFVQTKRKLLSECELWCVLSLPPGVFVNAGAGVKTNLLFFTKGRPTERVWYYDVSDFKVTKRRPLTLAAFDDFTARIAVDPDAAERDSERSWYVSIEEIRQRNFDLRAINPNAPDPIDRRSPGELMDVVQSATFDVQKALDELAQLLGE